VKAGRSVHRQPALATRLKDEDDDDDPAVLQSFGFSPDLRNLRI